MEKVHTRMVSAIILGLIFISACSQESQPDKKVLSNHPTKPGLYINDKRSVSIADLELDDPILYVNCEAVTKRDFEALLVLHDRLWRIKQNVPFIVSKEEMEQFRHQVGNAMMLELIQRALFRQYAKEKGIVPQEDEIRASTERFLKSLRKSGSKMSDLADAIGGDAGKLFKEIPYIDVQDAMLRQSVTTNDLSFVTKDEMARRIDFVKRFDANAEAMNERARKRLREARERILAGAEIADEAKSIFDTVHPEYAEKWGRFEIQEFPSDEDVHKWLLTANAGDISEPLDVEDGIAIIKVLERGRGEAPPGQEPPLAFTLVRCTVKALEKMRYQTPDEMRRQILIWKQQEAQKKLGMTLIEKAVIEYPNGTNLFMHATTKEK